jgi:hypothetical protein
MMKMPTTARSLTSPKPPEQGSAAEQVAKDNERIQKGAP